MYINITYRRVEVSNKASKVDAGCHGHYEVSLLLVPWWPYPAPAAFLIYLLMAVNTFEKHHFFTFKSFLVMVIITFLIAISVVQVT